MIMLAKTNHCESCGQQGTVSEWPGNDARNGLIRDVLHVDAYGFLTCDSCLTEQEEEERERPLLEALEDTLDIRLANRDDFGEIANDWRHGKALLIQASPGFDWWASPLRRPTEDCAKNVLRALAAALWDEPWPVDEPEYFAFVVYPDGEIVQLTGEGRLDGSVSIGPVSPLEHLTERK